MWLPIERPFCPFPFWALFRNSYLEVRILHLSFGGLGKGTDPIYSVIHSSYTLHYTVHAVIALMGGVCFGNHTISRMRKRFLICTAQFRNCVTLQITQNIYTAETISWMYIYTCNLDHVIVLCVCVCVHMSPFCACSCQ